MLLLAGFAESVARFRGDLIRELLAREAEVHLAAPALSRCTEVAGDLRAMGVCLHDTALQRTGTSAASDLVYFFRLCSLIRRVGPAVTLAYTVKPVVYGLVAAWLVGVPRRYALITGLGYAFTGGKRGMLAAIVRILYRHALGRAHMVIFQNHDDERLFRHGGLLPSRVPSIVVNGSGVNLSTYPLTPLNAGPPSFLMIARLLGDKGVREYAEAAHRVKARYPEARFRLVGWRDSNPDAIAAAELEGWIQGKALEFLGKMEDVRPAIADCTVYVLPSYREGTPRTVLEAMAMGRAIITTDAPGCRETVIDGENGFLVPVKSVDALVEAMQRFIDDPRIATEFGLRSRRLAEDRYDVRKVNMEMLQAMGIEHSGSSRERIS